MLPSVQPLSRHMILLVLPMLSIMLPLLLILLLWLLPMLPPHNYTDGTGIMQCNCSPPLRWVEKNNFASLGCNSRSLAKATWLPGGTGLIAIRLLLQSTMLMLPMLLMMLLLLTMLPSLRSCQCNQAAIAFDHHASMPACHLTFPWQCYAAANAAGDADVDTFIYICIYVQCPQLVLGRFTGTS